MCPIFGKGIPHSRDQTTSGFEHPEHLFETADQGRSSGAPLRRKEKYPAGNPAIISRW